jgi:hypothetical protein
MTPCEGAAVVNAKAKRHGGRHDAARVTLSLSVGTELIASVRFPPDSSALAAAGEALRAIGAEIATCRAASSTALLRTGAVLVSGANPSFSKKGARA